jgi:beta-1,4-mannosyl-glycoprotein beta-1,4-N-acetylglucosaminyltransferase
MTFAIVSLHTPNYQVLADFTWDQNKLEYANYHGYKTILKLDGLYGGMTIGYEKIFFLRDIMRDNPEIEWFWWLGTDTLITNYNIKLEDVVDPAYHFIIGTDGNGMNADSFFIRNTIEGRNYIDWIIANIGTYDPQYFREQQAMIDSYDMPEWKPIIKIVPQKEFNAHDCWPNQSAPEPSWIDKLGERGWWEQGDFVVHWPGSSLETRMNRMVPYYMPKVVKPRKIYDCFTFFNEYDLLELRLEEQYEYVDHFVIVESNKSFQNRDKPWNLEAHWERYAKYHDKMIYVKVEDMPGGDTRDDHWRREFHQRDAISRGIVDAQDNDIIVIGDCDEMIRGSAFEQMRNDMKHQMWICRQPIFWARLNYWQSSPTGYNTSSMAVTKQHFQGAQMLRNFKDQVAKNFPDNFEDDSAVVINNAGWHFSYLGTNDNAKTKLLNFAHSECNHYAETVDLEYSIERKLNPIDPNEPGQFEWVVVNDYFPKTILNNLEKYKDLIVPNATADIKEFLPPL